MVRNPDRELRDARAAYIGAVRRASDAFLRFDESDIPLDPGTGPDPYEWTRDHIRVVLDLRDALHDVATTRRTWDAMRREHQPPH